jgi:acyl-CoA synthetase (AMP-forming)/AMP-acid ligase II
VDISFILSSLSNKKNLPAIITDDREYLFSDIYREYENALVFLAQNKIKAGSVTALIGDYSVSSISLILALAQNDCTIVPISQSVKTIADYIKISQSEFVIDLTLKPHKVIEMGANVESPLLRNLAEIKSPGLILFSSGTTGQPKAALHNLSLLLEKFKTGGKALKSVAFLLFDHIGGFNTLMHAVCNGSTLVLTRERGVESICKIIEKHKIELLPATPTFLNLLLLGRAFEKYDISSLKIISYGTEPMLESTLTALCKIFPNVKFKQTYGLSELGIMSTKSEKSDSLWLKLGGLGFETKIIDNILYVKAKSAMLGYLNAPSPFDKDGWFNTRDRVEVKGEYIKILGRETDIINVGGQKVYPSEVENILIKCKGVKDIKVFGQDNIILGKTITAQVQIDAQNNDENFIRELRQYAAKNLERFKIPSKFILTEESLFSDRLKKKR